MINDIDVKKIIQMSELCELLNTKDIRSAIKWCQDKKITIFSLCNKRVTYRFMVDIELDKTLIKLLKQQHPNKWEGLYKCYTENDRFEYMMLLDENKKQMGFKSRATPRSKIAKEFVEQNN